MSTDAAHTLSIPFKVASWDEKAIHQLDSNGKITTAAVTYTLTDTTPLTAATAAVDYLMSHPHTNDTATAHFVGFIRLAGQWEGKEGTAVLREVGSYTKSVGTASELVVVEGSGRGVWDGVKGRGTAKAGHGGGSIELTLELAA